MEIIVSRSNIEKILIAIISQYKEQVKDNKIKDANNTINNILDLVITGDDTKILADNGTYKDSNKSEVDNLISKFNDIISVMTISKEGDNYKVVFPEYEGIETKLSKIINTGTGNKVFVDNGEYVELAEFNEMTDEDITNMINQIQDGE